MYGSAGATLGGMKITRYGESPSRVADTIVCPKDLRSIMQLHEFKEQLERYVKSVNGNGMTVISVKADDLRTLIALAEERLKVAARDFPGGKVKVELPGSELPKEPSVNEYTPVNAIQDKKGS